MINVAFTISSLSMGGIERVTTTIANALADQSGFDVTLINLANKEEYFNVRAQHHIKPSRFQYDWWRAKRKLGKLRLFHTDFTWRYWIERLFVGGHYDYIILNPDFFPYFDIVKRLHPESKIYLWMHNNYDVYVGRYYKDVLPQLKHASRESDGIICLERYSAKRWKQLNDNVHVIYNPLTLETTDNVSTLQNRVIACTSRLVREQKGLDYVLEVAGQLPEGWQINYAGDGSDREWMESEISERHLEQRIRLLGALDDEQLDWHYTQASMFLCLSRWEGFGLVVVEAMSRGLPVIAFDMPAMKEVLQEGKDGVLAPMGDTDGVCGTIAKFADNRGLREHYAALSLKRCKDFSITAILHEWILQIFNDIA